MSRSRDFRVGQLRLFELDPARYECGSAAFRAESLWLSVKLLQDEAMPLEAQPRHKSKWRPERHSLSARNAAEPQEVSLREATFGFGMLALELWTFDFFVYSIEKYFASG